MVGKLAWRRIKRSRCRTISGVFVVFGILVFLWTRRKHEPAASEVTRHPGSEEEENAIYPDPSPVPDPATIFPSSRPTTSTPSSSPLQVLILSHYKFGAGYFGSQLTDDASTFYWPDPLEGYYGARYGLRPNSIPTNIFTFSNGSQRTPSDDETSQIVAILRDAFFCDFDGLNPDVLSAYGLTRAKSDGLSAYQNCLKPRGRPTAISKPVSALDCNYFIQDYCPETFNGRDEIDCAQQILNNNHTIEPYFSDEQIKLHDAFQRRETCSRKMRSVVQDCLHLLQKSCDEATIIIIKETRIRLSQIKPLLSSMPNLKVVYYSRNPQSLLRARQGVDLSLLHYLVQEDERTLAKLEKEYPQKVFRVSHADFLSNALETVYSFYSFLGKPLPETVRERVGRLPRKKRGF